MSVNGEWVKVLDPQAQQKALHLTRGRYQREVILGTHNISGSTLSGKARDYAARYKRSREALLERLTQAQIPWSIEVQAHGRKILVFGEKPDSRPTMWDIIIED
jgi:hypothetical protein